MKKSRFVHKKSVGAAILSVSIAFALTAHAQTSNKPPPAEVIGEKQIPLEHFTDFPKYASVTISPDGKSLAAVVPAGERRGLVVVDLSTQKGNIIARYNDMDIRGARWISNNRLTYSLTDRKSGLGEQFGSGFFAIDKDGSNPKEITPISSASASGAKFVFRGYVFADVIGPETSDIYAYGTFRSDRNYDLYRLNTITGKGELLSFNSPGNVQEWILNDDGKPIAATSYEDRTGNNSIFILNAAGGWDKAIEFNRGSQGWVPVDYIKDEKGEGLIVVSNLNRNTAAVQRFDLASRKITETMAEHPRFDLGVPEPTSVGEDSDSGASVRPVTLIRNKEKKIIGIRMHLDKETTVWTDKDWQTWQTTVDKAIPNRVNRLRRMGDTGKILVFSYSDRQPGEYLVYSPKDKKLEELFASRPWIKEEQMAEQRFITYKARDGRDISAYITIPNGSKGKAVPLIMHPHGGPALRSEYFGWDAEPQFFASRGYMVIQPEYRGAQGFGYEQFKAGFKQWGLAMQDDLTDGVLHLVKEGLVDKNKVCIVGGSYGGYAVAMGLVKDPDLYKCGINVVGVTASQHMNEISWTDFAKSRSSEAWFDLTVGNSKTDAAILAAGNAVNQADKIKAPMLMIYGLLDQRVPLINGERMRDAMQKAGKKHEWVVYKEEGHGFLLQENRRDYYRRMEKFLAENLK
jgi:dipeptidyl aminopeptidase/acylaminoacyl peptidase